jgi:hypothetical protein
LPTPARSHHVSGFIAAEGSLEDLMQDIDWDSAPIIFDANGQIPLFLLRRHLNVFTLRRVQQGITNDVQF